MINFSPQKLDIFEPRILTPTPKRSVETLKFYANIAVRREREREKKEREIKRG